MSEINVIEKKETNIYVSIEISQTEKLVDQNFKIFWRKFSKKNEKVILKFNANSFISSNSHFLRLCGKLDTLRLNPISRTLYTFKPKCILPLPNEMVTHAPQCPSHLT